MRQYKWMLKCSVTEPAKEFDKITEALDYASMYTSVNKDTCVLIQNHRERTREAWQFDWSFELVPAKKL